VIEVGLSDDESWEWQLSSSVVILLYAEDYMRFLKNVEAIVK